jgi:hypothetical protein
MSANVPSGVWRLGAFQEPPIVTLDCFNAVLKLVWPSVVEGICADRLAFGEVVGVNAVLKMVIRPS